MGEERRPPVLEAEVHIQEYQIPEEILGRIPEYFYAAFAGELFALYGPSAFVPDEDGLREYRYHAGTFGWAAALWMACKKCDMQWLHAYYDSLEWYESDRFDEELEKVVETYLVGGDWTAHGYFKYVRDYQIEEGCGYTRWMK